MVRLELIYWYVLVFIPWPFRPKGYYHYLRLSIYPSDCRSVRKLYLVRMITHHRFELESPNLHQTCIIGYSWLVLKMKVIDLELQGHFGHFDWEFLEFGLVHAITRHKFGLESPNLHQTCTLEYSRRVLKIEVIDLDLQGHFVLTKWCKYIRTMQKSFDTLNIVIAMSQNIWMVSDENVKLRLRPHLHDALHQIR